MTPSGMDVSVVVPVRERPEDLVELYRRHAEVLREKRISYEFLFVAEPGYATLTDPLLELAHRGEPVRVIDLAQAVGGATVLRLGATRAKADVILTIPAYRRVDPTGILALLERLGNGVDLVVAHRWPREDSWVNRLQNRLFHSLLGLLANASFQDVASGVLAVRKDVLLALPLYGDFSRFLPLLAVREGYRAEEVPVPQDPGDAGARIYSPGIYLRRILDVAGLVFLLRFTEKPLRFFGLIGGGLSLAGAVILLVLFVQRVGGEGIADRPLLLLGVLLLVVGFQSIALGLVGEIIVHLNAPSRSTYRLQGEAPGDEMRSAEHSGPPNSAGAAPTAPTSKWS